MLVDFYNTKTGSYVKTPNPGVPLATTMAGNLAGGALAGAGAQVGSQVARQGAIKGLTSIGGRLMGLLGGSWGLAITVGLPLLIEGISYLSNSVDRNTEAQNKEKEDPTTIRAQNEERFINAVRLAIKEGMRDFSYQYLSRWSSSWRLCSRFSTRFYWSCICNGNIKLKHYG